MELVIYYTHGVSSEQLMVNIVSINYNNYNLYLTTNEYQTYWNISCNLQEMFPGRIHDSVVSLSEERPCTVYMILDLVWISGVSLTPI